MCFLCLITGAPGVCDIQNNKSRVGERNMGMTYRKAASGGGGRKTERCVSPELKEGGEMTAGQQDDQVA